jgi:hypothetical protein
VELIRYKPGEAIRWLELGAQDLRKSAQRKGKSLVRREGERSIGKDVRQVAGALMGMGKGALADILHHQAQASEYILHDSYFEIVTPNRIRSFKYDSVASIKRKGDKATVVLDQGSVTIRPHAFILSGRVKVPVGWSRNGMEVPYEVLIDELAGRCDVDIEDAA